MIVREVKCKTALSLSRLQGYTYALNPYRGCEHGCIYCYASSVLHESRKWGTFVDVKRNIPNVLAKEVKRKRKGVVGVGTVTDGYQPIEKRYQITRNCLIQLLKGDFPICIQTKSSLVTRDLDVLTQFSRADVGFTITTIDEEAAKTFEPYSSPPSERLKAMKKLSDEGIITWAFIGPILPGVTEVGLGELVKGIANTGAKDIIGDRLNLKKDTWLKISSALQSEDRNLLERFRDALFNQKDYFQQIDEKIRKLCQEEGITYLSAFA